MENSVGRHNSKMLDGNKSMADRFYTFTVFLGIKI